MDTTTEDAALPIHCRQMPKSGRDGPWSRVFIADSWFGSVEAAVALGKRKMHFIGAVKTAHGGFPKQYIEGLLQPMPSGVCIVLESEVDGVQLQAIGYKYNRKKVLCFVCTKGAGATEPGEPYIATYSDRFGNLCSREVSRPGVISRYFAYSPAIDNHNQRRQHEVALEGNWGTKSCWSRLGCTLLGVHTVDCLNVVRYFAPNAHQCKNLLTKTFQDNLAHLLMNNKLDDGDGVYAGRREKRELDTPSLARLDAPSTRKRTRIVGHKHHILAELPKETTTAASGAMYVKRMQRKCSVKGCCRPGRASHYCTECSDPASGYYVAVHTRGDCLKLHCEQCDSRS